MSLFFMQGNPIDIKRYLRNCVTYFKIKYLSSWSYCNCLIGVKYFKLFIFFQRLFKHGHCIKRLLHKSPCRPYTIVVPSVIGGKSTDRERVMDIFSRLLLERIICINGQVRIFYVIYDIRIFHHQGNYFSTPLILL